MVSLRVRIIALDVAQQRAELLERHGVESPMLFKTCPYPGPEFIHIFRRPRHADYRHVQVAVVNHGLQRGEDLLKSEIPRSAEKNECVRLWNIHGVTLLVGLRRCVPTEITVCTSLRGPAFSFRTGDFKIAAVPAARNRPEKHKLKRNSLVVWNYDVAIIDS